MGLIVGFNFDYRRAERRVKPITSLPVEQHTTQVSLPAPAPSEKPAQPTPTKESGLPAPQVVEPPAPATADEPATEETSTTDRPTPSNPKSWGRPTAQIWIGSPPDDIAGMFPAPHREKIKEIRTMYSRSSNFKYALVNFNSVEEATAAIETLSHAKVKYGEDYSNAEGGQSRGQSFSRGGGSFSQGSYESRKPGGSDTEGARGGFGRGGRGGRGGTTRGSTGGPAGTFGSRGSGSGSPAPLRGRGRGGISSSQSKEVSGQTQEWNDKPETKEPGWSNEEKPPVVGSTSDDKPSSPPAPTPSEPHSTTTAEATPSLGAQSSTAGGESQS